jgi:hypothetical protein
MSRPLAALLGVVNLVPIAYLVYFLWHVGSMQPGVKPEAMPFERLFSLHLAMMALILVLTIVYLVIAYRSPAIPNDRRSFWAVALFMGTVFAFPVFWYLYVWRNQPASSAQAL